MFYARLMRTFGIKWHEIWGCNPIPTIELDILYEQIPKINALEGMDRIAQQHNPKELQDRYIKILDNRTEDDLIEQSLKGYEALAASVGQTISQDTKDAYRGK